MFINFVINTEELHKKEVWICNLFIDILSYAQLRRFPMKEKHKDIITIYH